jgi:hypothetical protein
MELLHVGEKDEYYDVKTIIPHSTINLKSKVDQKTPKDTSF